MKMEKFKTHAHNFFLRKEKKFYDYFLGPSSMGELLKSQKLGDSYYFISKNGLEFQKTHFLAAATITDCCEKLCKKGAKEKT